MSSGRSRERADRTRRRLAAVRFAVLGAAIALTIAVVMLSADLAVRQLALELALAAPLAAGLYAMGGSPRILLAGILGVVAAAGVSALAMLLHDVALTLVNLSLRSVVVVGITGWVMRDVLAEENVSTDTILGGICVYLLVGFLFAHFYLILELAEPGSLAVEGKPLVLSFDAHPLQDVPTIVYYSYTTLTTLAFGDITPLRPGARLLSITEGALGQLYPAVFIARLVSLSVAQHLSSRGAS
jgi:voltage-gated potassium channel